jgi:hypothetical protein
MTTAVEALVQRIQAIEWRQDDSRDRLHVQLMREYLRRAALWAQALGATEEWSFFDIARLVDADVRADDMTLRRVREHLEDRKASWWGQRIAEWALHFTALPAAPSGLPNPYEPLIVMFDNGGDFTTETGIINIDYTLALPTRTWCDHLSDEPVIDV